ncbi:MAG: PfkB family carbohydrate kinase [Bacillota bacterium]|nr:PfkB family carbohydrate kinase [Bacillota bacterium]
MRDKLLALKLKLESVEMPQFSATLGFDGFIDKIIKVVDKRESIDSYIPINSIAQFGERISRASGLSTNIELVPITTKLGGNGPIMGNAMVRLGVEISYVGALGIPNIDPIFFDFIEHCQDVYSIGEPGQTDALEFSDGKIMLGKMESLGQIGWDTLLAEVGEENINRIFGDVDLVANLNWTMVNRMNEIWQGFLDFLSTSNLKNRPSFFVDLADPGKRNEEDLSLALELLKQFTAYYKVVLGLNYREALEVASVLRIKPMEELEAMGLEELVSALAAKLDLSCIVIHAIEGAIAFKDGECVYVDGPYTATPKLTTGAGDNFNAGFCLGLMLGLTLEEILIMGTATSGFYVRNSHSPTLEELISFLGLWKERFDEDF